MIFLGYIVSKDCIRMDPKEFSSIVAPIIECLKGDKFKWTGEADEAFRLLKKR